MNRRRGSAVLVVLVLLALLSALLIANSRALSRLHRELQHLEQRHQRAAGTEPA